MRHQPEAWRMFVTTLVCDPEVRLLTEALADDLCRAWGGGGLRWLSFGEAVEFAMPAMPEDRWSVWAVMQAQGVDLIVQPEAGRRKRLLLADMDSTMIRQECIDELAAMAGVGERVAAITRRAMNGELDFEGALVERVGLLRGLPVSVIDAVLRDRITYMPGGFDLVATMKAHGARAVLVSGGFTAFTERVGAALGFDETRANRLLVEEGRLTGEVARPILGREAKVRALDEVTAAMGITAAEVIAVGDGANDLGMLERAGTGVALHAKPAVAAQCEVRINHADLRALLFVQGYARDEFVT
jgi:phosphoserine phosphatase